MPPPGLPRPDPATYDALAGYLETELDRAAAAKPNPGKLPLLHRLSRTEYQNAVRDLLAVEALLEVKRRVAPYLHLELVAFPQDGILGEEFGEERGGAEIQALPRGHRADRGLGSGRRRPAPRCR